MQKFIFFYILASNYNHLDVQKTAWRQHVPIWWLGKNLFWEDNFGHKISSYSDMCNRQTQDVGIRFFYELVEFVLFYRFLPNLFCQSATKRNLEFPPLFTKFIEKSSNFVVRSPNKFCQSSANFVIWSQKKIIILFLWLWGGKNGISLTANMKNIVNFVTICWKKINCVNRSRKTNH